VPQALIVSNSGTIHDKSAERRRRAMSGTRRSERLRYRSDGATGRGSDLLTVREKGGRGT
jgi:hypothetical protein